MGTFFAILALVFGMALIGTGGWLTFTRRPLAGVIFIVFGAFVTLFSLATPTSVTTSGDELTEIEPHELVSATPSADR